MLAGEKNEHAPDLDAELFRHQAYIGGAWCDASTKQRIEVFNPSTGVLLGDVPSLDTTETRVAIEAAGNAYPPWRALLAQERGAYLLRWHDLIVSHREALATLITLEQGKPITESRGEIDYGASFVRWFAEEGQRAYGETIPSHLPGRQLLSKREPLGVVALVTPWNFPNAMLVRKAAAALAAGCTVVAYQSMETPFSALALAELTHRAGFPKGVFNVLTGRSRTVVAELCASTVVRGLSFTGSTEVGRTLLQRCAVTVKRTCMELGGHAPFIGFPDVDVNDLVEAAIAAKFQTTGQDCLAANRLYIHRDVYDEFLNRFVAATESLKVGDGFESGVDQGPLQNEAQLAKAKEHVANAVAKGARLLSGGKSHPLGGLFYEPTVLADVTKEMNIYYEETFGPVAAVIPFDSEAEVVAAANDSQYGLAAYVYARDIGICMRLSDQLEYGMVAVNTVKMTGAPAPFGGVKQSGLGKEGSKHGIDEFTELKYICISEIF